MDEDAETHEQLICNVLDDLDEIADLDYQARVWGDANRPPWQSYGETMCTIIDDACAEDVAEWTPADLGMEPATASRFRQVILGIAKFSKARIPNRETWADLKDNEEWLTLSRQAADVIARVKSEGRHELSGGYLLYENTWRDDPHWGKCAE
jgi:hypothetical protein